MDGVKTMEQTGDKIQTSGSKMAIFKGLGQNIVPLTADEMDKIYEERIEKIKSLGLSGIMTASLEQELATAHLDIDNDEDESNSKGEMMGKIAEDLEDFGQIE